MWAENEDGALKCLVYEPVIIHADRISFTSLQLKHVLFLFFVDLEFGSMGLVAKLDPGRRGCWIMLLLFSSLKWIKSIRSGLLRIRTEFNFNSNGGREEVVRVEGRLGRRRLRRWQLGWEEE